MKLRKVDPRKIRIPEVRVKSYFDEETKREFREAIKEWGIEQPVLCFEIGEELVLVDGENRIDEAIAVGTPLIDVVSRPGDMIEVITRNLRLDVLRGKHRPTDMIKVVKSLYEEFGLDSDNIKDKVGRSRDYIERLIMISKASSEVLEALDAGAIGVSVAYELSRLPYQEQQEEILAKSTVYRLKAPGVKDLVEQTLNFMKEAAGEPVTEVPKYEPKPRILNCEGCKHEVDGRYIRPVFLCPDCFGHVWRLGKVVKDAEVKNGEEREGD